MSGSIHVVLVEDEEEHCELVRRALEVAGTDVDLDVVGTVGAAHARLAGPAPDLLIVDLRLPDGDGIDVLAGLGPRPRCPVMVLTGHGDEHAAVEAMRAGAMDYVVKSTAAMRALPRIVDRVLHEWELTVARDRAEAATQESEERYRTLVEDMPFLVMRFLPSGEVSFVNDRYLAWRKTIRAATLGLNVFELRAGDGFEVASSDLVELTASSPVVTRERPVRVDGEVVWERWVHRALFDDAGRVVEYQSIGEDVTGRKRDEARLERLAMSDHLTGLANRRQFNVSLRDAVTRASECAAGVALLFIDIDGFKSVNDSHGHEIGDQLLRAIADRLRTTMFDALLVARLGGDELAVIVECPNGGGAALPVADRVVASFSPPFVVGDMELSVTASVGVSMFPDDGATHAELVDRADEAMYLAKARGKNRYAVATP